MTDVKKSLNSIINERISSPFYGTLILSWLIWNWKYLTKEHQELIEKQFTQSGVRF